jgi:hypothetical protein
MGKKEGNRGVRSVCEKEKKFVKGQTAGNIE